LLRALDWVLEPLLAFRAISARYTRFCQQQATQPGTFFDHALGALEAGVNIREEDLARIPAQGPVVLVANHPFGAIDGIALGQAVLRVRPDVKLLVNHLLARCEGFPPWLITVDAFGGEGAQRRNLAPMKAALQHLKAGGVLLTWPSGTVSHFHWKQKQITDPPWAENLGRIIRRSGATVVPVFFPGRNSLLFQAAGLLHPRLRTLLLPREMWAKRGRRIEIRVGSPLGPSRLKHFDDDRQLIDFLRLRTYILQNRQLAEKTSFLASLSQRRQQHVGAKIPEAAPAHALEAEITALPAEQVLIEQGDYLVGHARAAQIPTLLAELGRLREITFRAVGEGTGQARDLDRFDAFYQHLFMWHRGKREIVGAYRLGQTDEILAEHGPRGLYTTTLFRYQPGVLDGLSPALELGRSFIVADYQRKMASLSLIWRGIGQYIARHPRYKVLFGPVSISKEYQNLSKNLMVMYLQEHSNDPELARQIKAKKPPRSRYFGRLDRRSFRTSVRDIDDVSALISEIEREDRGVPVLLRQYLKLNATVLSFNIDPDFGDCLDGLLLVDLSKTDEKTLRRYMGETGADAFYAYHELRANERVSVET